MESQTMTSEEFLKKITILKNTQSEQEKYLSNLIILLKNKINYTMNNIEKPMINFENNSFIFSWNTVQHMNLIYDFFTHIHNKNGIKVRNADFWNNVKENIRFIIQSICDHYKEFGWNVLVEELTSDISAPGSSSNKLLIVPKITEVHFHFIPKL